MSWNLLICVPYFSNRILLTVFLSLSNLGFDSHGGSLLEKSALGKISKMKTLRNPSIFNLSYQAADVIDIYLVEDGADVITTHGNEDVFDFEAVCVILVFIGASSLLQRSPPRRTNLAEPGT